MTQWVRVCGVSEAPGEGQVCERFVGEAQFCLARIGGELKAMDNLCPHRDGPLGQGWVEGAAVVCPWHSWAFNADTGCAEYPDGEKVAVYAVRVEGDAVEILRS